MSTNFAIFIRDIRGRLVKIRESLKKIQNLPLATRKIIFWLIIIVLSLGLFGFWLKNLQERTKSFEREKFEEQLNLPQLKEELKELRTPEIEENLEKLKETLEQYEKEQSTTTEY